MLNGSTGHQGDRTEVSENLRRNFSLHASFLSSFSDSRVRSSPLNIVPRICSVLSHSLPISC